MIGLKLHSHWRTPLVLFSLITITLLALNFRALSAGSFDLAWRILAVAAAGSAAAGCLQAKRQRRRPRRSTFYGGAAWRTLRRQPLQESPPARETEAHWPLGCPWAWTVVGLALAFLVLVVVVDFHGR